MMTRTNLSLPVLAAAAIGLLIPAIAHANGRFPASVDVVFQPGNPDRILLPVTFGLLISNDGGQTFEWICEEAVGYGGLVDPDYAVSAAGTMFASTFDELRISRDGGCSWETQAGPLEQHDLGAVDIGSDGAVWVTTATAGVDNDVFLSTDDGVTFGPTGLLRLGAEWEDVHVAPSDPQRVYVTGALPGASSADRQVLLYRSLDGGQSWAELSVAPFQLGPRPEIIIEAVAPDNADLLYARSVAAVDTRGDILYRSTDGGQSWTELLPAGEPLGERITAVLARDGGEVFAGTLGTGVFRSTDSGETWAPTEVQPQMACLGEREDGTLFACGANFAPDLFALGRSADGQQWEPVVRFAQVKSALACPPETVQFQVCEVQLFPSQCEQFSCRDVVDAGPDPGDEAVAAGCCDAGADPRGGALMALLTLAGLALVMRRRSRA